MKSPPTAPAELPKKPSCITIWGILITLYGTLGICNIPTLFLPNPYEQSATQTPMSTGADPQKQFEDQINREVTQKMEKMIPMPPNPKDRDALMKFGKWNTALFIPLQLYALVIGIGLLMTKPWARRHAIILSTIAIAVNILMIIITLGRFGISWWGPFNYLMWCFGLGMIALYFICRNQLQRPEVVSYFENQSYGKNGGGGN
ncbi:MAG: hypothetical protein P8M70_10075, partial [Verrucomicrobiota bacterium]|nr:hypothetical protein [Verrucomicrobiota bacterium]